MTAEQKAAILAKLTEVRDSLPARSTRWEDTKPFRLLAEVRKMVKAIR